MSARSFAYRCPRTLEEALGEATDPSAKLLAGGQSLLPLMKLRLASPEKLIDLERIEAMRGIRREGPRIRVGALTTHATLGGNPFLEEALPLLARCAREIGDMQVRNRGTLGGSLAHGDPSADLPAAALALEAEVEVRTQEGTQMIPVDDFFLGPMLTAMPQGGIVTSVTFAVPPEGSRSAYAKVPHPASGYAVVGVAAVLHMNPEGAIDHARIGLTGLGETPYRARRAEVSLVGQRPSESLFEAAALEAVGEGSPVGDVYASAGYRARLAKVTLRRTLAALA